MLALCTVVIHSAKHHIAHSCQFSWVWYSTSLSLTLLYIHSTLQLQKYNFYKYNITSSCTNTYNGMRVFHGPSPDAHVPDASALALLMRQSESDLLRKVAPLLPLPPSRAAGPPGPSSPSRGSSPPGREDAPTGGPPPETLGPASAGVDNHPHEVESTTTAPLSEPVEELAGVDSHMHLDRCFSKWHGFGCRGRTLSDLREHAPPPPLAEVRYRQLLR